MKRETGRFETKVLFDSREIDYNAYTEWAEDIGEEPNMADYYDWYSQEMECGQDYVDGYFKIEEVLNSTVIVFGSLGLWNGRHEIEPKRFENWKSALGAMLDGGIEEYRISQVEDDEFVLEGWHHDGRNEFHFRFLSRDFGWKHADNVDFDDAEQWEVVNIDQF